MCIVRMGSMSDKTQAEIAADRVEKAHKDIRTKLENYALASIDGLARSGHYEVSFDLVCNEATMYAFKEYPTFPKGTFDPKDFLLDQLQKHGFRILPNDGAGPIKVSWSKMRLDK